MKVRIVADSSANLLTAEDKGLVSVPLTIVTDHKEYVDNEHLDIKGMTDDLAVYKGRSGSACPGTGDWLAAFGDADWVFGITITSSLSGSYNAARVAQETYENENPGKRVFIVDSLSAGPELKVIVEMLQELIESGKDFDGICEEISAYQKKTGLSFVLKSLTNLANNGRVNPAIAKIAGVLGIQVVGIASVHGELEQKEKVRGEKKALLSLYKSMKEQGFHGGKVRIDHCFNEEAAKELKSMVLDEFENADVVIGINRGLCSFYAEPGGMLVGYEC